MTGKKSSRRERERAIHRKEILDTALRLFSERGFRNVSMQQIAEASEFAVGTLYNFFGSKEALLEEMTDSCAERILGDLLSVIDGPGSERGRLENLFRIQPKIHEDHADFIRFYVSEMGQREPAYQDPQGKKDFDIVINTKLAELIAAGVEKGEFRRVDPLITAKAIMSLLRTLGFETAGHSDEEELKAMFGKVEQLFVNGLLLPGGAIDD